MADSKPSLPVGDFEFCPATLTWFETWRQNSVSDDWDDRHWQYMFDTAIVHSMVYGSFNFSMLGELDKRERYMGLTFPEKESKPTKREVTVLQLVQEDRAARRAAAASAG